MSDDKGLRGALAGLRDSWGHDRGPCDNVDCEELFHNECNHSSLGCHLCQLEAALASHPLSGVTTAKDSTSMATAPIVCDVCKAIFVLSDDREHLCGLTLPEAYSLGWRRGNNLPPASPLSEKVQQAGERERALLDAAKAICHGCRDGLPVTEDGAHEPAGKPWFSCEAEEILALVQPVTPGRERE